MPSAIIEMLDNVASRSSRFSQRGKIDAILRDMPLEEAEIIVKKISEKDIHGYWVRPHEGVARVFREAGHDSVTKSSVERFRSRLNDD